MIRAERAIERADALLARIARRVRLLPHITPENAAEERARLVECVARGRPEAPRWTYRAPLEASGAREAIGRAVRALGTDSLSVLYRRRLRKLRFQLDLLEAIGSPAKVLAASRRVFGSADARVHALALEWLCVPVEEEARDLPAQAERGQPSVATALRAEMLEYGVLWPVRVERHLAASAAICSGEVLLGGTRLYSREEAQRLAAHEVGVHLVAHENAREQPLSILAVGTSGATRDQEGLALWAEIARGAFTPHRRRMLAARTIAVSLLEDGLPFGPAACQLVSEHRVSAADAVTACERAFRGGGLTKDAVYLSGLLRVGRALARRELDLEAASVGRVSLEDLPLVRTLLDEGLLVRPRRRSRELARLGDGARPDAFSALAT